MPIVLLLYGANPSRTVKSVLKKQLRELWSYMEEAYDQEQLLPNEPDFKAIDLDEVAKTINTINDALKDKESDKKVKQKLNYARKNWPGNLKKYQKQEAILGKRNSYSKTDPDAIFMRMKDDYMQNGQLKPGDNLQASTNNQFITNYTLAQTTADTTSLKDHLQDHIDSYEQAPQSLTADAGYGSEENYTDLEEKEITTYVKYNYFHKEQRDKKHQENPFHPDNLFYNKETGTYYYPMDQAMKKLRSYESETTTGFKQQIHRYQTANCKGYPLRKAKGNRAIERNHNLIRLKEKARTLLLSEEGIAHRKRRCWDVEAVFGNIKQNIGFKRFMLRGMDKVTTEIGLIAMEHNLRKFSIA